MWVLASERAVGILGKDPVFYGRLSRDSIRAETVCPLSRDQVVESEGREKRTKLQVCLPGAISCSFDAEWVHAVRIVPAVYVKLPRTGGAVEVSEEDDGGMTGVVVLSLRTGFKRASPSLGEPLTVGDEAGTDWPYREDAKLRVGREKNEPRREWFAGVVRP